MRALLALAAFCVFTGTASGQTYQFDAAHSGNASGARLGTALTVAWSAVTTPQGTSFSVVAPGRVYTVGEVGTDAAAYALDSSTGAVVWAVPFADRWADGPYVTLAGDTLIASTGGVVVALDAATGTPRWTSSFGGTASAPVVADGLVLASRWINSHGANVVALRLSDGVPVWTGETTQAQANPTVAAGLALNMVGCGALASRLVDGTTAWALAPGCGSSRAGSAFDGERVWAGLESRGAVYDPATGADGGHYEGGVPAFSGELAVSVREGSLVAYDRHTLLERWHFTPPAPLVSAPLIADGVAYATDNPGNVYRVDVATGTLLATVPTGARTNWQGEFPPGLAAGDGLLIVPTENGIVALRGNGAPPTPSATTPQTATPSAPATTTAIAPSSSALSAFLTRAKTLLGADRTRLAKPRGRHAAAVRALRRLDAFRRTAPKPLNDALALHRRGLISYRSGHVRSGRRLLARAAAELRRLSSR